MLKAYLRRFRDVLTTPRPSRESIEAAFRGFVAVDGNRGALMSSLADDVRVVRAAHGRWLTGGADRDFAKTLLDACAAIDDGNVWHDELKFRSYVDVSIQVKALRALIGLLDMGDPLDATTLLLAHDPSSRPALLVHAELQLERGDAGGAIETVRRALRVQAVCTTAQAMLFRAYAAARAQGSAAPELEALDYDLSDKFCRIPFTHFSTGVEGKTFACTCPSWVPFPIGNVLEAESAEAIWNSDVAMEIRRSILDGDFAYCSRTQCSYISARKLPRKSEITNPQWRAYIDNRVTRVEAAPLMVELNHDPTCNLACPSCRTEIVSANAQQIDRYAAASERVILPLLRRVDGYTYITGGGEAFSSKHFRSILRALNREEFPGLNVYLITNGQALTPHRWGEFPNLPPMIGVLSVSIDAARAATYETLRRPGKWDTLMRNLEFAAEMRRRNEIRYLGINFVVQKANFREMLEFVALGNRIGADNIWFQRVVNYGAYDEAAFADADVGAPSHPDHAELLEILRNPLLDRPHIQKQMLLSLLPESEERCDFLYA